MLEIISILTLTLFWCQSYILSLSESRIAHFQKFDIIGSVNKSMAG